MMAGMPGLGGSMSMGAAVAAGGMGPMGGAMIGGMTLGTPFVTLTTQVTMNEETNANNNIPIMW